MIKYICAKKRFLIKLFTTLVILYLGFSCLFLTLLFYNGFAWPTSNMPSTGKMHSETSSPIGSWGSHRTQIYTLPLPMREVQQFYDNEMARYCVDEWVFVQIEEGQGSTGNMWDLSRLIENPEKYACLETKCEVRRWWLDQTIEILMCEVNQSETIVVQQDLWKD